MGSLSITAINAREDKFLYLGGPLMAGLTIMFISTLSSLFIPARFVKTLSAIENLWLYGGLALFSGYVLYDTQKLMSRARKYHGLGQLHRVDYVNESIGIYMDVINIFYRLVIILSNGNRK